MGLGLLAPAGLAALAALLLPLLLHLARRTPQRRTEFAALRWLAARLRPRRRLRIEEWMLLLLRLVLVACVALLFAQPVRVERIEATPWVLVHPAIGLAQAERACDCKHGEFDWRWLAPGFPATDAPRPNPAVPVASLLREADALLPPAADLVVIAPRVVEGLDAERPVLSRAVDWRVAPSRADGVQPAVVPAPPRVVVLLGAEDAVGRRYLRAAARANGWRVVEGSADTALPAGTAVAFWLDATPVPAKLVEWARAGGTLWLAAGAAVPKDDSAQRAWHGDDGRVIARQVSMGRGRRWQWQAPLRPDELPILLEPGFAGSLAEALAPEAPAPSAAFVESLQPRTGTVAPLAPRPQPLDTRLAWLAVVLFALERWLATRARRSAAP